jgi:hypothetical protein
VHIRISRTGGFAGVDEELTRVDTTALDAGRAAAVADRLDGAGFFALPAELPAAGVGADHFTYSVTVRDGGRSHTVSYRDDGTGTAGAGPLRGLVDLLLDAPGGRPGQGPAGPPTGG